LAGITSGIPRNPPNLESVIASVNNSIINASEVSCALGKKRKAKDAPWWSDSPTFVTRVRDEVLDVTLLSRSLKIHLRDWHVSPEESMSNHKIILYKLQLNTDCSKQTRNPRKTNWGEF